jgi:hypothetical protein
MERPMNDDPATRSQRRRQHVLNATCPIGSIDEVTVEVEHLARQVTNAQEALTTHRRVHGYATAFPWFVPFDEQRARFQRQADTQLTSIEDRLSRDVLVVLHRASSIVQQLRARAEGVDASGLLCSDFAESLVLQDLMLTDRETLSRLDLAMDFDLVAAVLEEVKVQRVDHTTDELIERARTAASVAAAIYADIARAKHRRNK